MAAKSRTLTREDWLKAALGALDLRGIEGVKILPLSVAIGASRGSFYWHFRDRDELLEALLEYWEKVLTDEVIERAASVGGDPSERLRAVLKDVIDRRRGRFDSAVRAWARHDARAAAVVRRVDVKRLGFLRSLFREMGFDDSEAESRARITLLYMLGDHILQVKESPESRRAMLDSRLDFFLHGRPEA